MNKEIFEKSTINDTKKNEEDIKEGVGKGVDKLDDAEVMEELKKRGLGDFTGKPEAKRKFLKQIEYSKDKISKEVDKLTDEKVIEELKKRDERFCDFVYGGAEKNREFLKYVRAKRADNIAFLRGTKKEEEKNK